MSAANDQNRPFDEKETSVADAAPGQSTKVQSPSEENEKGVFESQSAEQEPRDAERGQDDLPAEPPSEQEVQRAQSTGEDYSVLTVTQKKLIVTAASLASLFSPMATAIYCQPPTSSPPRQRTDLNRSLP